MSDLRDQIAAAIHNAVKLHLGPNAGAILAKGGTLNLTPGEAENAADAVITALSPKNDAHTVEMFHTILQLDGRSKTAEAELERLRQEYADATSDWDTKRTEILEERDAEAHHAETAEAERDQLKADLREARLGWTAIDIDNTNLIVRNEAAIQKWDALTKKLYTAWWSARIGRAQARQEANDTLKDLWDTHAKSLEWQHRAILAGTERDQLKATIARVRGTLAEIKHAIDTEMSDDQTGLERAHQLLTTAIDPPQEPT